MARGMTSAGFDQIDSGASGRGKEGVSKAGRNVVLGSMALLLAACAPEATTAPADAPVPGSSWREPATVVAAIARLPEFSTIRRALTETARIDNLRMRSPVTLLAPRDTAFARLSPEARAAVLAPQNREALARTIDLHIIPRALRADELKQMIATGGGSVQIASRGGPLTFTAIGDLLIVTAPNGARASMGAQEITTGNGSVYVLDRWLGAPPTGE